MPYKGRITRTGNSTSFAFESALFRSHPEFESRNVEADYIGRGVLLVRTVGGAEEWVPGDDPILCAFLSFIERDMLDKPDSTQPLAADLLAHAERLVGGMQVNLDAPLSSDG
jgi:antitoxin PrlF